MSNAPTLHGRRLVATRRIVAPLTLRMQLRGEPDFGEPSELTLSWERRAGGSPKLVSVVDLSADRTGTVERAEIQDVNGFTIPVTFDKPVNAGYLLVLHGSLPENVMGPAIEIDAAWAPFVVPAPCGSDESARRCSVHGLPIFPVRGLCGEGIRIARECMGPTVS